MENLNGIFEIKLTYGKMYGKITGKNLFCRAKIEHKSSNISGIMIDIGGEGLNTYKAVINGTYEAGILKFIKRYDNFYYINKKGEKVIYKRNGYKIYYDAKYDRARDEFIGKWSFKVKIFGVKIGSLGYGTWTMRKIKDTDWNYSEN